MPARRILLLVGGLSLGALLFGAAHLRAGGTPVATNLRTVTAASPIVTGRISGDPLTATSTQGTPPEPSPLAPLPPPIVEAAAVAATAQLVAARATPAVTATPGPTATPAATPVKMPASAPPDVVDDSRPIAGSVFDHQDYINRHPVESARSITKSTFDHEDAIDEHPVP